MNPAAMALTWPYRPVTTSTYFEADSEDGDGDLRRYGHSKDHRPLPQFVIGLAVTREGSRCGCVRAGERQRSDGPA